MPTAHGFDEMHNTTLYHLNAYTYTDRAFNPDFPFDNKEMMAMWDYVVGAVEGKAGEKWTRGREDRLHQHPVPRPEVGQTCQRVSRGPREGREPVLLVPQHREAASAQPAAPETRRESRWGRASTSTNSSLLTIYVGEVMDKVRELGIGERNPGDIWTTDNGAWQAVDPDCGYTPFRGTKGTDYEGGSRVPAIAWWPGMIEPGRRNSRDRGFIGNHGDVRQPGRGHVANARRRDGKPTTFRQLRPDRPPQGHGTF